MIGYDRFFASVIGAKTNPNHYDVADKLIKKCNKIEKQVVSGGNNWLFQTYNTHSTHSICTDKSFKSINKFVAEAVQEYCKDTKLDASRIQKNPTDGWLNIYNKGDSQEFHTHANSIISAVYYLKAPIDSARFYFKNPYQDMLAPQVTEATFDNTQIAHITPIEGSVIIFRSYIEHMVQQHNIDEQRISLAYNFYKS